MIHSYDTDLAIALGGIAEAVVLKEIAYWCKRNEESGKNEHDGRFWTYNSQQEWQNSFPELNARGVLLRLREGGWLLAAKYSNNPWIHTLSYALSDKAMELFKQIDLSEMENRSAPEGQSLSSGDTSVKQTPTEKIQKEFAAEIDRLYSLYPGQTETREGKRSTGKCSKDKQRIAGLLKTHTVEQIERSITKYLEETGGRYLKNFSTFLNNLPEYEEDEPLPEDEGYIDF